ncbi:MAG TPA: hypothetical protein VNT03_18870 [Baekduia sp.]|nr:hypothetical protein [Baekduia sp.]
MTSQGSPYARLRRAILTGNLTTIDAAAREVPAVPLKDALAIVVLLARRRDRRYGHAAARWAARAVIEERLDLDTARRLLALLDELPNTPGLEVALERYVEPRRSRADVAAPT